MNAAAPKGAPRRP